MRTSSKILLAVILVAAAVLAVLALHRPPPSPQDQITAQVNAAVIAANHRSAGGIMQIISAQYHDDNGYNTDVLHALLARGLQNNPGMRVTVTGLAITVQGSTATSQQFVEIDDLQSGHTLYSHQVTLNWQKEPARSFLVFPSEAWRVVSASYGSIGGDDSLL